MSQTDQKNIFPIENTPNYVSFLLRMDNKCPTLSFVNIYKYFICANSIKYVFVYGDEISNNQVRIIITIIIRKYIIQRGRVGGW